MMFSRKPFLSARRKPSLATFLVASIILLFGAMTAWAGITGSISGVVTDPSGAVVPGVKVIATSASTSLEFTAVTDAQGFYIFPVLNVDHYTIKVSHPNYKNYQQNDIKIDANSAVRVDVTLELGAVTNTITVGANALQVETENTQMGEVIEKEKITSVPLNGRSFIDLLALQPGVSPYQKDSTTGGVGVLSVNGGRPNSNGFMVNGADAEEKLQNGAALIPNIDSIAEFRIITNNFNAEYGNYSGGQINVVTKSGSNQIHGDAFDFLRNTDLDAKNYYSSTRGVYIQNQFGGTVGGPIRRGKMFWFGDYQGTKQIIGAAQNFPVPSTADRTGNLIDEADALEGSDPANGGQGVNGSYFANILSKRLGYTVTSGEAYYSAGCTSSANCVFPNGVIPQKAWSPVAVNTLKYIPTSNVAGQSDYETSAYNATLTENKGGGRVDANSRFGALFGYYFIDKYSQVNPYTSAKIPGFADASQGQTQAANAGLTTTLSNSSINDVRLVYMRYVNQTAVPIGGLGPTLASLGFNTPWNSTGGIGPIVLALQGVPAMGFDNYSFGASPSARNQYNNTVQAIDNFTKIVGKHSLQFGGDFHYDQVNLRLSPASNGQFDFDGSETGLDFADYLLGAPDDFIQASYQVLDSRAHYYGVYAQDSWRARPSLTINMGVRYEIMPPWYDTQNKIETLVPGEQSVLFPGAPKGLVMPGDPGVQRGLSATLYRNVAPRIGFAYSPSSSKGALERILGGPGKTSIRGGWGIFYSSMEDCAYFYATASAPYGLYYESPTPSLLESPYIDRPTGFNEGIKFPFAFPPLNTSASHPDTTFNWAQVLPLTGGNYLSPNNLVPTVQNFELSVQRQLGGSTVGSVSYVGSIGRHLLTFVESNPGDPSLCLSLSTSGSVAPGSDTCGPFGEQSVYTTAAGETVNGTRPLFGNNFGSNPFTETAASSSFNSLQASLKHTSKYAEFLVGYTYSKSMDNGSGMADVTNPYPGQAGKSRALSLFDNRHVLVASYSVPLPFNKFMAKDSIADYLVGGWVFSGVSEFASGQPITLKEDDDRSLSGTFGGEIDVPSYSNNGSKLYNDRNPRHGKLYFNRTYFKTEPLGQVGNAMRRSFAGPGLLNSNMAVAKSTKITEGTQLQFRAEAFNVFNHAQFLNPSGDISNSGSHGFGYVTKANDPRILQVALKLLF